MKGLFVCDASGKILILVPAQKVPELAGGFVCVCPSVFKGSTMKRELWFF